MRYFIRSVIIIFVAAVLFSVYANIKYNSGLNTDYPVIKCEDELIEVSVNDGEEALLKGLSASDATDGDLTDKIVVASISHFLEPGKVNVKYVVFDSHNNSASITRKVFYKDYKSPEFSLSVAPVYTVGKSFDLLNYVKVNDSLDGDISDRIRVVSNMVNNYMAGVYPIVLEVSNSCGDTSQITLWVTYKSKADTVSVKLHQYIVYVEQGETFEPEKWLSSVTDSSQNELDKEKVEIKGVLDTQTAGDYQLVYSYDDGNNIGQAALTVVVKGGQK